jgi:hypothetical protein
MLSEEWARQMDHVELHDSTFWASHALSETSIATCRIMDLQMRVHVWLVVLSCLQN